MGINGKEEAADVAGVSEQQRGDVNGDVSRYFSGLPGVNGD